MQIYGDLVRRAVLILAAMGAARLSAVEGAAYLKVPQGARSSAMGGAGVARDGSAELAWHSPAAISGLQGAEISVARVNWLGDTHNDFLALAIPMMEGKQTLALYGNIIANEDIGRNALGADTFQFVNTAITVGVAYAISFEHVTLGLGAKRFGENFGGSGADGWAPDLGLRLDFLAKRVCLGFSAINLEQPLEYENGPGAARAPSSYRFGLGLRLPQYGLSGQLESRYLPQSAESGLYGGLEWARDHGPYSYALRGGYDSRAAGTGGLGGPTLGLGMRAFNLHVDVAWTPYGSLGSPYRMMLSWNFGKGLETRSDPPAL